jgi:hypothetical protein
MKEAKIKGKPTNDIRRRKRAPLRQLPRKTDIYVRNHRPIQSYLQRIRKLFDIQRESCVTVHGLGAALLPAIEVAMNLRRHYGIGQLKLDATTSTVTLVDDMEPMDDRNPWIEGRKNNAIHIRLYHGRTTSVRKDKGVLVDHRYIKKRKTR